MLAYPDTNPAMLDDEKLAARDRLYRRLVAAHCDNDSVSVEQVEEWLIVTLDDQRWRVFFGFKGYVELVHDDSPAQSFDVNDPGDDDLGWYHHQLMTNAVGYAQGLLDESGLQRQRAEEERMDATLKAITRRQAFAAAREMASAKNRRLTNWAFAMELYSLGSTYARAICKEMGIDPDAKTATRFTARQEIVR